MNISRKVALTLYKGKEYSHEYNRTEEELSPTN